MHVKLVVVRRRTYSCHTPAIQQWFCLQQYVTVQSNCHETGGCLRALCFPLQVDTDGGGSVGLQEFETWWIETQRQQARSLRPRPELTVNALVSNLHSLSGLLERRGMSRLAADIT